MAPERRPRLLASAPVSTLVPAPPGAGEGAPAPASRPHSSVSLTRNLIAGLAVAAALVALVFLTSSSIDQTVTAANTWSQIVITFLGAGACAAVVLIGGRGRAWGAPAVALFAAFTAFAALSILWSAAARLVVVRRQPAAVVSEPRSPAPSHWAGWRRDGGPRWWAASPPR